MPSSAFSTVCVSASTYQDRFNCRPENLQFDECSCSLSKLCKGHELLPMPGLFYTGCHVVSFSRIRDILNLPLSQFDSHLTSVHNH